MADLTDAEVLAMLGNIASVAQAIQKNFIISPDDPRYLRRSLLVASARKLDQQIRVLQVLAQADCLEEAVGLARVIVEVVINALYLQDAEEQEVESFISFDVQKISERLARDHRAVGDTALAANCEAKLVKLATRTGRIGSELSWSRRSPAKRAKFVDERAPFQALVKVHDTVSRVSNFSMHGTFMSMAHLLPLPSQKVISRKEGNFIGTRLIL